MKFKEAMTRKRIFAMIVSIGMTLLIIMAGGAKMKSKSEIITIQTSAYTQTVKARSMKVEATAYYGDTITSTGTTPKINHTIAVDPKVIPYGTKVYIPEFNQVFVAEDCGSAIKGNKIDIFMQNYNQCMKWGIRTITIYILEE